MQQIDIIMNYMEPHLNKSNKAKLREILTAVLEPTHVAKTNEEIISQYLNHCKYIEQTDSSIKRISFALNHLANNIDCPILEADHKVLTKYLIDYKETRKVKARTLNTVRAYIAGLYNYLYVEEWINKNPMLRVEKIREPKEQQPNFTEEEVKLIRDTTNDLRDRAILEFLIATGCRRSEVVNLRVEDIDFSNRTAFIKCGKGRKDRTVFFDSTAKKHLQKYLKSRNNPKSGWLFVAYSNKHKYTEKKLSPTAINGIFNECMKKTNLTDIHPHKFRHYCISKLIRNGMRPELVAKQAGHSSVSTTLNVYTNVEGSDVEREYNLAMSSSAKK